MAQLGCADNDDIDMFHVAGGSRAISVVLDDRRFSTMKRYCIHDRKE
jgi:hypothetical protein